ncbi:MAG: MBL fold metallo-hydrolase [Candidatus Actinomarina sp.]
MNKIILLGTGCPSPSHIRFGPSTLISYQGVNLLIDAGSGVTQRLSQVGIQPSQINHILITHLHSDHIVDLYQLYISGWHTGRTETFKIHGPKGLKAFFETTLEAYNPELSLRRDWENRPNNSGLNYSVNEIDSTSVLTIENISVNKIDVDHYPVEPAFGYEIKLDTTKVIYSGDTRYCKNLERAAHNADYLIHEVLVDLPFNKTRMTEETVTNVTDYHTSPKEVGVLAENAKVKKLILNHFVPPVFNEEKLDMEIKEHYSGEIVIGKDLLEINL